MTVHEFARLELLAEIDAFGADLRAWSETAPDWDAARHCQALVRRLLERLDTFRVRLEAPLVVMTLGGTGAGKSALVNALVGESVTASGKERPTTRKPRLIAAPQFDPARLGLAPGQVEVVACEAPLLKDLVLIDSPDPDTTEDHADDETNLARLRAVAPYCDVLLVAATQQKYHSAQVTAELAAAAPGARLVFVQTHADCEPDIREDWRRLLAERRLAGEMFFIDSLGAREEQKAGRQPRGDFARLLDLLTRQFSGAAAQRIRRANYLDLVEATLAACLKRCDAELPAIARLEVELQRRRGAIQEQLAAGAAQELLASRRPWEQRLLAEATARWGFSPFALLLRLWQGLGSLLAGAALARVRTPAQLAIWGAVRGGAALRERQARRQAEAGIRRAAAWGCEETLVRGAALELVGYARDAGLRASTAAPNLGAQLENLGEQFSETAAVQIQSLLAETARRNTGWGTRLVYELLWLAPLAALLYRLGRNFFYDSWLAYELGRLPQPAPLLGLDFFMVASFWLLLWSGLLLGLFLCRLRRGLRARIADLAGRWADPELAGPLFAPWSDQVAAIHAFRAAGQRFTARAQAWKTQLESSGTSARS